jgi:hypothetical protein
MRRKNSGTLYSRLEKSHRRPSDPESVAFSDQKKSEAEVLSRVAKSGSIFDTKSASGSVLIVGALFSIITITESL